MPGKLAIVALARRLFKILVILVIAIILLRDAGVNVTAMLAGLGVGGVALALAAQKTLENLFGGISLIMREAIRVGDFCKVADQTGTVEDIGLGSTRLRTLDRTLVSVPNAQVSQMNLENISLRDKFWLHHTLELRRDTSPDQMRYVLGNTLERVRGRIHALVDPLSTEQLWQRPYPYGNSIGHLLLHLTGNLSYYIGAQIAGTGYVRNRPKEFADPSKMPKEQALQPFDAAVDLVIRTLAHQSDADWGAPYQGAGADDVKSRLSMFIRCVSHADHHAGQIIYLAKELTRH